MLKYVLSRMLYMVPTLLGIIVIVFTLMFIAPGDPAVSILGDNASPDAIAQLRKDLRLDDSYFVQLGRYVFDVLRGDLGNSFRSKRPVIEEILDRYPTTLKLTFGSLSLGIIFGILAGIISAIRQYSFLDKFYTTISLFGVSAPSFWIAMLLVLIFSVNLKFLPATGSYSFAHWILPIFTMGLQASAFIMRMTRSSMLEVIRQDYIRTAKAKGQSEIVIVFRHALRNAMVPIVTIIGIQICSFLAGSVLVETVFALPGLGKFIVDSVSFKDYPAVQGAVLWIGLNCIFINLIVDIIYCFIDPRIKTMYRSEKIKKSKFDVDGRRQVV